MKDPTTMSDDVLAFLAKDKTNAIGRLRRFLSIPTVSTDPAFESHVRRGAKWVADTLEEIGLEATVQETGGHPVVVGKSTDSDASTPHVLFYGHYDVQPPDPLDKWTSPPFAPEIRDNAIVARGASDDKGQVSCFLEALRAWKQVHGRIPVPVTVLIEGEEECGSENLADFVRRNKAQLKGPGEGVVVISDTTMWETPTESRVAITYGLRGMLYYDVQLHGPQRDLHSGMYGGTLANPATMLARVLGGLLDERHHVTIPHFYDDVVSPTDDERRRWSRLNFNEKAFLAEVGVDAGFGEDGFDVLSRRWARPTCDLNGLYGGYGGDGAKTVIPSFAGAKVSFRLAPDQRPDRLAAQFEEWIRSHEIPGCRWELTCHGQADPVLVPTDSPHVSAAGQAVKACAGHEPVLVREGATIPIVADFKNTLGMDSLLIGFARRNDCIHAPNEKFDLACFELGCRTHAVLLREMAKG